MLKLLRILFILPIILGLWISSAHCQTAQMPSDLDDDTLFLAATLWGEARDDSVGMQIVANTVINRKKYYEQQSNDGKKLSIKDIVSNTEQYASWKDKNWDTSDIIQNMAEYQGTDKEKWASCIRVAKLALKGKLADITSGATSYYAKDAQEPDWARNQANASVETINNHVVVRGTKMEDLKDKDNNVMVSGGSEYKAANPWESFTPFPTDAQSGGSDDSCNGVEALSRDISSATDSGHGILSDATMQNMTEMLNRIYKNLGRVFMLGHGMLCYATKVAYTCIGMEVPGVVSACWIKSPHLSFFITGLSIYFTAFLMSIAVGMYFIDISFKLGFAIMYLPVAVALWPFAPTKSKFGEAFGMVLHNAMLYALMSIGLTYAIVLIYNGILGDVSNWTSFWSAIEKESSERLAENFSMGSTRIMVILFCLIFGFKILASSVNEYLDYFFSDGLMGGQSPMHYLGTQALGMTAGMTIGKIGGYAADVASTQTGRLVESGGDLLVNASKSDFGDFVSNTLNKASNTIIKGRQYAEQHASDALNGAAGSNLGGGLFSAAGSSTAMASQTGTSGVGSTGAGYVQGTQASAPTETGSAGARYAQQQGTQASAPTETGSAGARYAQQQGTQASAPTETGSAGARYAQDNRNPASTEAGAESGSAATTQPQAGVTVRKMYNDTNRDRSTLSPEELKKLEKGEEYIDKSGNVVQVYRNPDGKIALVCANYKGNRTRYLYNQEFSEDQINAIEQKLMNSPQDLRDIVKDVGQGEDAVREWNKAGSPPIRAEAGSLIIKNRENDRYTGEVLIDSDGNRMNVARDKASGQIAGIEIKVHDKFTSLQPENMSQQEMEAFVARLKNAPGDLSAIQQEIEAKKQSQGNAVTRFFNATRPDENTLRPSNIISKTSSAIGEGVNTAASAVMHPQSTYRTVKQLVTENISDENSRFQNGKIILKNTGKVIYRKATPDSLQQGVSEDNTLAQNAGTMAQNAAVEGVKIARATTSDTVGFAGKLMKGLGKSMQQNYNKDKSSNFYAEMQARRKEEEREKYYENLANRTDVDSYDENS